jgi:hypothetical protein
MGMASPHDGLDGFGGFGPFTRQYATSHSGNGFS